MDFYRKTANPTRAAPNPAIKIGATICVEIPVFVLD
jgi:hypothetical protein